ncbi:MAG: DMT family transporter [Actinomycetota bacterium]|nr:DMT family transporter [Actinomycetota bacterium]
MPTEVSAASAEPVLDRGGAHLLWAALTLLAGAFLSLQSRMNGELAVVSGRGLDAALWSFGSGLVLLTLLLLGSSRMRSGFARVRDAVRGGQLPRWQVFGGSVGALYVFNQTYAVPVAGVALFTIAVVGGQTASAIAVDRWGVGPAGKVPVTAARVAAAVLATVGVIIAVGGRASGSSTAVILPIALAVVVGALMTVQQATNGRVNVASGNPFTTTWMNFAVGTVVLLVLSVPGAFTGTFGTPGRIDAPWWAWLGGVLGIGVVAVSAIAVRHLGVLQVMIFLLFGQLVSAVVLDALAPATRGHISPLVIGGLVTTLVAAILSGVAANRARRHTGSGVAG